MRFLSSALVSFLALAYNVFAKSSTGDSVLVVIDPSLKKEDYSKFFGGLEERGYQLTFRGPKDTHPPIEQYGIPGFSHVILFTPETKSYAFDITPQSLVELLSEDTNLLVTLSAKQTPLSSLSTEFSLIPPPPGTPLVSHHPARSEPATVIPVPVPESPLLTPGTPPVWFSGVPHAFGNSPYLVPILRASSESFAADSLDDSGADALVDASEKAGEGLWAGSQLGLVTGFQTLKNSRVVFAGGVEIFGDQYANKALPDGAPSGNEKFVRDVTAWAFRETLALRIDNTTHHRVGEEAPSEKYTTNHQIVYTAHISAYDPETSSWKPYSGITDMQLEFTMLDPHIRIALPPVAGEPGKYQVQFRAP
ncbi:Dolichyl-diphosphooligosaccharide--protein glycosyltransferase subunit WBP1, partial [Pisolithus croceorrhizus]